MERRHVTSSGVRVGTRFLTWSQVLKLFIILAVGTLIPVMATLHHRWVSLVTWLATVLVSALVLVWLLRRGTLGRWVAHHDDNDG